MPPLLITISYSLRHATPFSPTPASRQAHAAAIIFIDFHFSILPPLLITIDIDIFIITPFIYTT